MSNTKETNTSFFMVAGVLAAAICGTAINAIISVDWFSGSMATPMAAAMAVCLTAMEFTAAHYLFKPSSGLPGRFLCGIVTASCVVAFLVFGSLPPLVKQISKTQIDVESGAHFLSVAKMLDALDAQIDQTKAYRDRVQADVVACDTSYPVPRWRTKNAQCKGPLRSEVSAAGRRVADLQSQKLSALGKQSDLVASKPTPSEATARAEAMAIIVGVIAGEGVSKSLQIGGAELVVALIRSVIAELSILYGAWALNRFSSANPLNLLVQLLNNSRTSSVQNELSWAQRRKFDKKNTTDFRQVEYAKLIREGRTDNFSSSAARALNIRHEAWQAVMTQAVIDGYLMAIHFSQAKQLNYRRPTALDGAAPVGKGKKVVMRLPPELRLESTSAREGWGDAVVDLQSRRGRR